MKVKGKLTYKIGGHMKGNITKGYYDDIQWAYKRFPQWKNKYGNRWIAVLNHRIVAFGDSGKEVIDTLIKKDIDAKSTSIMFVEKGAYVY